MLKRRKYERDFGDNQDCCYWEEEEEEEERQ